MSRSVALYILGTALLMALAPSPSAAQTQTVTVNLAIPFSISKIDAGLVNLGAICELYAGTTRLVQGSGGSDVPLSSFSKSADGTVTGTLARTFAVPVPTTAGGQAGRYVCRLAAQGNGVGAGVFLNTRSDKWKTLATPDSVSGSFVW